MSQELQTNSSANSDNDIDEKKHLFVNNTNIPLINHELQNVDILQKIVEDSQSNKIIFVVENGFNTCYISSLLMALFYKPSCLDKILSQEPKEPDTIYLQEMIKAKFVDKVRSGISVLSEVMNEIRTYANICGWLKDIPNEMSDQQDVNEFFGFLIDKTDFPHVEIQRRTITEGIGSKDDVGVIETIPFINLIVPYDVDEISVKELLIGWMNNNTVDVKRHTIKDGYKIEENVKALNIYEVQNVPPAIGISLNRFNNEINMRIETKIDIQRKIKLHHILDEEGLKWKIHSIVCHTGETHKSGHYYSVIFGCGTDSAWYLFNDLYIPSLQKINMKDHDTMEMIKRECVFLLYTYESVQ